MDPEVPQGDDHDRGARVGEGGQWLKPVSALEPDELAFVAATRRALEIGGLIATSPLVGVVPVARAVAHRGVVVELLALEVRAAGLRAWLRFAPEHPHGVLPGHPVAEAHDSRGTAYEAVVQLRGRHGSGGEAELLIVPRPPEGVATLTISVTRFVVPPSPPPPAPRPPFDALDGPWEFMIELDE